MAARELARAVAGRGGKLQIPDGLVGRVLRGGSVDELTTLSADPGRRIVFLVGSDGFEKLTQAEGSDVLRALGYSEADIERRVVEERNTFMVAVFSEQPDVRPATWEGIVEVVGREFPQLHEKLAGQLGELKKTAFEDLERQYGAKLADIDRKGPDDERFMTAERYQGCKDTPANARAFLYFVAQCRELFTGDGYTKTPDGKRGVREYVARNLPLVELGAATAPIDVSDAVRAAAPHRDDEFRADD